MNWITRLRFYILILSLISVFLYPPESYSQEPEEARNSLSIEGASYIYLGNYTLNYERTVFSTSNYGLYLGAGFGGWYFLPVSRLYSGNSIPITINNLFGSGKNHFEIAAGVRYTFLKERNIQTVPEPEPQDVSEIWPVLNIGYRYQDPTGKGLLFRAFIGLNGIGIGVGKAF